MKLANVLSLLTGATNDKHCCTESPVQSMAPVSSLPCRTREDPDVLIGLIRNMVREGKQVEFGGLGRKND